MTTQYTIAEINEFAKKLALLYADKARCTIMINSDRHDNTTALIYPKGDYKDTRHIYGKTFEELADKVAADAETYFMSNRPMTAEDLGIAA